MTCPDAGACEGADCPAACTGPDCPPCAAPEEPAEEEPAACDGSGGCPVKDAMFAAADEMMAAGTDPETMTANLMAMLMEMTGMPEADAA